MLSSMAHCCVQAHGLLPSVLKSPRCLTQHQAIGLPVRVSASAETPRPSISVPLRPNSPAALRQLIASPGLSRGPACFDALSASLVEQAGFPLTFISGFSVSASLCALPDMGLLSYAEMLEVARRIAGACSIPVIADADTGYGGPLNVRRTVRGYADAGVAGIIIEDQEWPKACGHTAGRRVVSREEALARVRAAADERDALSSTTRWSSSGGSSGSGTSPGPESPASALDPRLVLVARSDARQAESLSEALWRVAAFANAGADVVFIDALESEEEMRRLVRAVPPGVAKLANMLEGGGKTPLLTPQQIEDLGFELAVYPLSLIGASVRAMQDALRALSSGRMPPPAMLPSFSELKEAVGFPRYLALAEQYSPGKGSAGGLREGAAAASSSAAAASEESLSGEGSRALDAQGPAASVTRPADPAEQPAAAPGPVGASGAAGEEAAQQRFSQEGPSSSTAEAAPGAAEAESPVASSSSGGGGGSAVFEPSVVLEPGEEYGGRAKGEKGSAGSSINSWLQNQSRVLRVTVRGSNNVKKLDFRVPAGFLDSIASMIPAVGGLDVNALFQKAAVEDGVSGVVLWEFKDPSTGDQIRIVVE